jgi:Flp pilus assembly protein TadD
MLSAPRYAIALNSAGRGDEERKTLADALARHPDNREILTALVQINQLAGDLAATLTYAERVAALMPNDFKPIHPPFARRPQPPSA